MKIPKKENQGVCFDTVSLRWQGFDIGQPNAWPPENPIGKFRKSLAENQPIRFDQKTKSGGMFWHGQLAMTRFWQRSAKRKYPRKIRSENSESGRESTNQIWSHDQIQPITVGQEVKTSWYVENNNTFKKKAVKADTYHMFSKTNQQNRTTNQRKRSGKTNGTTHVFFISL